MHSTRNGIKGGRRCAPAYGDLAFDTHTEVTSREVDVGVIVIRNQSEKARHGWSYCCFERSHKRDQENPDANKMAPAIAPGDVHDGMQEWDQIPTYVQQETVGHDANAE